MLDRRGKIKRLKIRDEQGHHFCVFQKSKLRSAREDCFLPEGKEQRKK